MPQAVKISTNVVSGSIKQRRVTFNVEGAGRDFDTLDGGNWYSNVLPDDGRWIIISESKGSGKPAFWLTAGSANSDLLTTVNGLPSRYNQTDFTDTGSALGYLVTNDYMVLRAVPDQSDADGVVLDYDAENVSSYPRTGTTWWDLSGFDYDGSLLAGPGFNNNGYIVFDGVDDRVTNSGAGLVNVLGADFTIEMLIKPTNINGTWQRYITVDGFPNQKLYIENNGSSPGVIAIDLGGSAFSSNGSLRNDEWFHIVGTNNGSSNLLYLNGEYNAASSAPSYAVKGSTVSIGAEPGGGSGFIGGISKTRIYNKALSATEIKQNYFGGPIVTDGLKLMVDASNLVSYESGSTTTYSLTGSYTGSFFNGTGYSPNNGGAFDFDGTNDEIRVQVDDWIRTVDDITVMGFVQIPSGVSLAGGPWSIMTDHPTVSDRDGFWWHLSLGGGNMYFRVEDDVNGEQGTIFGASPLSSGNTYHLTTVVGQNEVKVYVDGEFLYGYNPPFMWSQVSNSYTAELFLGRTYPGYYLDCNLPSVLVYGRALTQDEIKQNYFAQRQKYLR